jgi:hypothetical protein
MVISMTHQPRDLDTATEKSFPFWRGVSIAIVGQSLVYLIALTVVDGGLLANIVFVTFIPYWLILIPLYRRHRETTSQLLLWYIRLGWIPLAMVFAWPSYQLAFFLLKIVNAA